MLNRTSTVLLIVLLVSLSVHVYSQRSPVMCSEVRLKCNAEIAEYPNETPPYTIGMPIEVLYTYMAIDSICKLPLNEIQKLLDTASDTLTTSELNLLNAYIYRCIDYNPIQFFKFIEYGWFSNQGYYTNPAGIYRQYKYLSHKKIGGTSIDNFLTFSMGIFEVEIADVSIDTTFNNCNNDPDSLENYVCITARVLDAIKGISLSTAVSIGDGEFERYIKYSYRRGTCTFTELDQRNGPEICAIYEDDSIGVDGNGDTIFQTKLSENCNLFCVVHKPKVGDRYLVFLDVYGHPCILVSGIPFTVHPMTMYQREGGIFRIHNGIFYDQTNFFGQGHEVDYSVFKSWLNQFILESF